MALAVKSFIRECQEAYYEGRPLISDEQYDKLVQRFPELEESIGTTGDIPHMFRMYSLRKFYPGRGELPPNDFKSELIKTPKLDGCAIEHLYIDGVYVSSTTRGDGKLGKDCTDNGRQLVPGNINGITRSPIPHVMQVRGEVVVSKPENLENLRNYASGKMNTKDPEAFADAVEEAGLIFVAYGVNTNSSEGYLDTFKQDMTLLNTFGFNTCLDTYVVGLTEHDCILTDGEVYRVNSNNEYSDLGFTDKFPRGAYAIKEDAEGEVTTLREVIWQVGKSGKVTPVGLFDPVVIDDAQISKATLNNAGFIEAMELTIGCQIRVIRSGGVIPKIVEKVDE